MRWIAYVPDKAVVYVLLGLMPFAGEPSATLLAQTRPTLIDLFVAALAGFAGVLALHARLLQLHGLHVLLRVGLEF